MSETQLADFCSSIDYGYTTSARDDPAGPRFLRITDITGGSPQWDQVPFCEADEQAISKFKLNHGDIVVARTGATTGVSAYISEPPTAVFASYLVRLKIDDSVADARFASFYLKGPEFWGYIRGVLGDKSAQPNASAKTITQAPASFPPLPQQHAIAGVLGSLDDKIEQNRRMSRALERLALAVFRAWFVDFEPVKAKAAGAAAFLSMPQDIFDALPTRFVESELGSIPDGWETTSLYDTAMYINGAAFKGEHFCEPRDGLPVIKIAELKYGITAQTQFSNRTDLDSKYQIDNGDMLYSWSGSPDTSLDTFLWTKGRGFLNQHIFKIVTRDNAQKHFVYYLLKHLRKILVEIARDKQTTGLGHVTVADMRRIQVCWSSHDVLDGFERQIGPLFEYSFTTAMETEKLVLIRDLLLPRLLSGQTRAEVRHG